MQIIKVDCNDGVEVSQVLMIVSIFGFNNDFS
jgi:hypothetical protein